MADKFYFHTCPVKEGSLLADMGLYLYNTTAQSRLWENELSLTHGNEELGEAA